MNKLFVLALTLVMPVLTAADGSYGCDQPMPTVRQIELNLPENIRTCPTAPQSPGYEATKRQTAKYIVGLYSAWEGCHGNLGTVNRLYKKWKRHVDSLS